MAPHVLYIVMYFKSEKMIFYDHCGGAIACNFFFFGILYLYYIQSDYPELFTPHFYISNTYLFEI